MAINVELALAYNLANAPLSLYPFPHFYLRNVFPPEFYQDILANFPDSSKLLPLADVRMVKGYEERFVLEMIPKYLTRLPDAQKKFWENFSTWLLSGRTANILLNKFNPYIQARFKDAGGVSFFNEGLLIEDITNYSIGPHSDNPKKVISVLFYLPEDESHPELGTSIYVSKQEGFTCAGGPHHSFEHFNKMHTMPFLPNSVFAFLKTNNSFHGVEKVILPDIKRRVFLFDIYVKPSAATL